MQKDKLLLVYYGDDFTGSTDALEVLSRAGVKTVLFIEPPKPEQLERFAGLQAIGVAGMTRSMTPPAMEEELLSSFTAFKNLSAEHVHYKVCSTFDSSPFIGSIGKAIDVGADIFGPAFIPLLVATPALGRYCIFGNLFARMGIGSRGPIYRLDRHPSMSCHPTTPADESDLRLHLSKQTSKSIGLLDILHVALPETEAKNALQQLIESKLEIILIDALYQEQMAGIGCLLDDYASVGQPLFSVGSSGIETALTNYWKGSGKLVPKDDWPHPGKKEPLLVASGSRSPVTSRQVTRALSQGFAGLAIDTEAIADEFLKASVIEEHIREALTIIKEGNNLILHTSNGDGDVRSSELLSQTNSGEKAIRANTAQLYGSALGDIIRGVARQTPIARIVIAGGDTSSYTARALGIEAVEMIAPLLPGAPLCKAYAPGSPIDGVEINFKGGQVGDEDYFERALNGW